MGLFRREREHPLAYYYVARNAAGRVLWAGTNLGEWGHDATTHTVYADTWDEARRLAQAAVARARAEIVETAAQTPQDDAESAASTEHADVPSTPRQNEVIAAPMDHKPQDTDEPTVHYAAIQPERVANVDPVLERATGATVNAQRAPYIYKNGTPRGGRPVKATKLQMTPAMVDYYRNRDGFQQDLELLLAKTHIGPAALARALGVSRGRIHAWRSQGLPQTMDPLAFVTIVIWVTSLRDGRWPWQR